MKVIIADDEMLVRISLRSMIEELGGGIELAAEATNGAELLELLQIHEPNIVLIDIRMPLMNGLEAIREGTGLFPRTQFIVISGYSDFTYAQEALKLGAADYLLKPVSPEDLGQALGKAGRRVKEQAGSLDRQFEADLFALFNGMAPHSIEEETDFLSSADCQGVVWYTDSTLPEERKAEKQQDLYRAIRAQMNRRERGRLKDRQALFVLPEGELAFVCAWDASLDQEPRDPLAADGLLRRLEDAADAVRSTRFAVTAIVTEPSRSVAVLQQRWSRLRPLAALRALLGVNAAYTLGELQAFEQRGEPGAAAMLAEQVCRAYRDKDYMAYMKAVAVLEQEASALEARLRSLHKAKLAGFLGTLLGCPLDPQEPINAWIAPMKTSGERILAELSGSGGDTAGCLVKSAIRFIEQHYAEDISILQIAKELQVTHNYLSTLFHKKTGTTFVKYLTRIRMMKAKELLAMPNVQVQQAAEQVGYYSTRHFTRLFTEFTGCYPSEYKKRFSG